jgi:hypothetical protein
MLLETYDKTIGIHDQADYKFIKDMIHWWRPDDKRMMIYLESIKEDIQGMLLRDVINNTMKEKNIQKTDLCKVISGNDEDYVVKGIHKYFYKDDIKKENCLYIKEICEIVGVKYDCVTNGDFFIQYDNIYNKVMKKGATKLTEFELRRRKLFREFFYLAIETRSYECNKKMVNELIKYFKDKYSTDVSVYGEADKSEYTQDILCQIEEEHPDVSCVVEVIADSKNFCIKKDHIYSIGSSKKNNFGLIIRFD